MYNLCLLISCIGSKCRELTADCGDCYPTALSHALLCRTVPWVFVESFCFAMFVESSRYYLHISSMALGEVASCSEVTGMMPCLHHKGWFLAFSSFPACMTSSSSLVPTMNLFRSMAKINFLAQIFPPRVLEFSESLTAFNLLMPVWLQENVVNVTTFQEHKQRAEDEVHGLIESINQQAVNCFVVSFFCSVKRTPVTGCFTSVFSSHENVSSLRSRFSNSWYIGIACSQLESFGIWTPSHQSESTEYVFQVELIGWAVCISRKLRLTSDATGGRNAGVMRSENGQCALSCCENSSFLLTPSLWSWQSVLQKTVDYYTDYTVYTISINFRHLHVLWFQSLLGEKDLPSFATIVANMRMCIMCFSSGSMTWDDMSHKLDKFGCLQPALPEPWEVPSRICQCLIGF